MRLEAISDGTNSELINRFQFLLGAIRSAFYGVDVQNQTKFQFLLGAIRRLYEAGNFGLSINFNSYLVRLEGCVTVAT